ncbi:MAG: FliM/FliN family flagellar motor switch protein [Leptospira sp.]|nr:FliM/FliN family flagellar motor switch protein [Leptospira sp.]NCS94783.1 FliM/FliN family flagellar motor switch protein [Leptospira sp.]
MAEFKEVELEVTVIIAKGKFPLSVLENTQNGTILKFDSEYIEPTIILVNGIPKFKGEVVTLGNNFGVKITDEC